jgi:outer membrane protein assembly factor BamE
MLKQKHILALILTASLLGLSACAYKPTIQQGTILAKKHLKKLYRGMPKSQVLNLLGKPVLIDIYHNNTLTYVYTLKPHYKTTQQRRLLINFRSGKVTDYKVFSTPNLKKPH